MAIEKLRYWVQKVLPLVYDDSLSYYELLNKVVNKINEMIEVTNGIPDLVSSEVQELVDNGTISQILSEIINNAWLNVKQPPEGVTEAKGDGDTDDTTAITEAIQYGLAHHMAVFFPAGTYKISRIDITDTTTTLKTLSLLGCGSGSSVLLSTSTLAEDILSITGPLLDVTVKGLGMVGSGTFLSPNVYMLKIVNNDINDSAMYMTMDDLMIVSAPGGIYADGSLGGNWSNLNISDTKGHAIHLKNCNNQTGAGITAGPVLTSDYFSIFFENCGVCTFNDVIAGTVNETDIKADSTSAGIYVQFVPSNPLAATPYIDLGTTNEFDVLFTTDHRSWSGSVTGLQSQIDALPTDQDVADAVQGEADLRVAAVNALQDQIDLLPTTTYVDNADNALQNQIDALPTSGDVTTSINNAINTAVSTLVNERLYNVKDFGAVGDGITDDTQAIQDCLDYIDTVKTDGDNVMPYAVFPEGQYLITSQLVIPAQCGIQGTMPLNCINANTGIATAGSWIYIKDNSAVPSYDYGQRPFPGNYATIIMNSGCAIRGMGFYYPDQRDIQYAGTTPQAYRWTIMLQGSNCEVSNVMAANPFKFLLMAWAHTKARIHRIFGCPISEGIRSVHSTDIDKITDIHFHGNFYAWDLPETPQTVFHDYRYNNLYGITLAGADWSDIQDVFVYTAKYALQLVTMEKLDQSGYWGNRHIRINRFKCEDVQNGVFNYATADDAPLYDASSGDRDLTFTDCVFASINAGVRFRYGRGLRFINCSFECSATCANLEDLTANTLIRDVTFIGCDFIKHSVGDEVSSVAAITSRANNTIVIGCTFRGGSTSNAYIRGMRIKTPGAHVTAIGNHFRNYSGYCFWTENATVVDAFFTGNTFENCTAPVSLLNSATINGAVQTNDGKSTLELSPIKLRTRSTDPTHYTGECELFIDGSGNLCYYTSTGTKRTLSYT